MSPRVSIAVLFDFPKNKASFWILYRFVFAIESISLVLLAYGLVFELIWIVVLLLVLEVFSFLHMFKFLLFSFPHLFIQLICSS